MTVNACTHDDVTSTESNDITQYLLDNCTKRRNDANNAGGHCPEGLWHGRSQEFVLEGALLGAQSRGRKPIAGTGSRGPAILV